MKHTLLRATPKRETKRLPRLTQEQRQRVNLTLLRNLYRVTRAV